MPTPIRLRVPVLLSLGLLLALAAGCGSDDAGPARRGAFPDQRHRPPTPLAGQADFFEGKISVAINAGALAPGGDWTGGERGEKGGGEGGGPRRSGGMGGGMNFGLTGMGGEMGGGRRGGPPRDSEGEREGGSRPDGMRPAMGSQQPPLLIHLQFTNHGPERVVLNIVDFVSPLGNFAVQPEKLALDPGQSAETEPMSSRLVGSLAEAEATLVLRLGGRSEKKVVVLRAVPADQLRQATAGTDPGPAAAGNGAAGTVPPAPGK